VKYLLELTGREHAAEIEVAGPGRYRVRLDDGEPIEVDARKTEGSLYSIVLGEAGGPAFEADVELHPESVSLAIAGERFEVGAIDARRKALRTAAGVSGAGANEVVSPMPGKVVRILKAAGATVARGEGLLVVEAMKMENELASPRDGKVKRVHVAEGQPVEGGVVLLELE